MYTQHTPTGIRFSEARQNFSKWIILWLLFVFFDAFVLYVGHSMPRNRICVVMVPCFGESFHYGLFWIWTKFGKIFSSIRAISFVCEKLDISKLKAFLWNGHKCLPFREKLFSKFQVIHKETRINILSWFFFSLRFPLKICRNGPSLRGMVEIYFILFFILFFIIECVVLNIWKHFNLRRKRPFYENLFRKSDKNSGNGTQPEHKHLSELFKIHTVMCIYKITLYKMDWM